MLCRRVDVCGRSLYLFRKEGESIEFIPTAILKRVFLGAGKRLFFTAKQQKAGAVAISPEDREKVNNLLRDNKQTALRPVNVYVFYLDVLLRYLQTDDTFLHVYFENTDRLKYYIDGLMDMCRENLESAEPRVIASAASIAEDVTTEILKRKQEMIQTVRENVHREHERLLSELAAKRAASEEEIAAKRVASEKEIAETREHRMAEIESQMQHAKRRFAELDGRHDQRMTALDQEFAKMHEQRMATLEQEFAKMRSERLKQFEEKVEKELREIKRRRISKVAIELLSNAVAPDFCLVNQMSLEDVVNQ